MKHILEVIGMGFLGIVSSLAVPAGEPEAGVTFRVRQEVLAELGKEHMAATAWRRTRKEGRIVAWGGRVLEWQPGRPALQKEVVPAREGLEYSNGGCALDVDGDGTDEIVVARIDARAGEAVELLWLKERPGQTTWEEHPVARLTKKAWAAPHDIQPMVLPGPAGKRLQGVALTMENRKLAWYRIPQDPAAPWEGREIATLPGGPQWGLAVGDIAGHRRPDIACGQYWAECPADPLHEQWTVRRYGAWEESEWGGMNQLALGDLDGDGRLEIVAAEAEIPHARLAIFHRDPAHPGAPWQCRPLEQDLYCPHSLALADLDADGRPDLIVGEMTAGGWDFPRNPCPRIFAYLNRGSDPFERHVLAQGRGVHEMGLAPGRRKGVVRMFAADEIQPYKFPEMTTPVCLWTVSLQR